MLGSVQIECTQGKIIPDLLEDLLAIRLLAIRLLAIRLLARHPRRLRAACHRPRRRHLGWVAHQHNHVPKQG